ncbi:MAG: CAP domain-containing protein [Ilumatobacteraceae bacterium]|nr:CAP domain-containing protein [Ilumatobacteraceae bacterium]
MALFAATAMVQSTVALPAVDAAPVSSASYVSLQPCRLADTRLTSGYVRIDALTMQIATRGICGIPANATSLALTLTVDRPQTAGFLTAWPADQARPLVSNLNFNAGQIRANSSITRVDASGAFRVFTSATSQVVVDVVGAFVPAGSSTAGRFVARPPTRLFDSRNGSKLGPGASVTLPIPAGVPADSVALALNVTVTESTGAGFVTEFPAGRVMPTSSILNVDQANQTRAAAGIFPVSGSGVALYVSGGGHIVVDLLGYFTGPSAAAGTDGLFTAYDPTRLLDTRLASPLGNGTPLYPGGGLELASSQGGSVAYNLTSVDGASGFVTAFPAGTARPATSTVNSVGAGDIVANFAITQVSNRGLGFYSLAQTHLVADLSGWFSGPSAVATQAPPANTPPPTPQVSFAACTNEGLSSLNTTRASVGVGALAVNAGAQNFACSWALQLASNPSVFGHSTNAARDAAVGCPTGENIAEATGTSPSTLISLWYNSPPHMTNVENASYHSAALAFVIRTEADGGQTIYGVTVFALC